MVARHLRKLGEAEKWRVWKRATRDISCLATLAFHHRLQLPAAQPACTRFRHKSKRQLRYQARNHFLCSRNAAEASNSRIGYAPQFSSSTPWHHRPVRWVTGIAGSTARTPCGGLPFRVPQGPPEILAIHG